MVEEREIIDIVESFSRCPALRQLVIRDINDIDAYGHDVKRVHVKTDGVRNACLPLRFRREHVPHIHILGEGYIM